MLQIMAQPSQGGLPCTPVSGVSGGVTTGVPAVPFTSPTCARARAVAPAL